MQSAPVTTAVGSINVLQYPAEVLGQEADVCGFGSAAFDIAPGQQMAGTLGGFDFVSIPGLLSMGCVQDALQFHEYFSL